MDQLTVRMPPDVLERTDVASLSWPFEFALAQTSGGYVVVPDFVREGKLWRSRKVRSGDVLLCVNEVPIEHMKYHEVIKLLRTGQNSLTFGRTAVDYSSEIRNRNRKILEEKQRKQDMKRVQDLQTEMLLKRKESDNVSEFVTLLPEQRNGSKLGPKKLKSPSRPVYTARDFKASKFNRFQQFMFITLILFVLWVFSDTLIESSEEKFIEGPGEEFVVQGSRLPHQSQGISLNKDQPPTKMPPKEEETIKEENREENVKNSAGADAEKTLGASKHSMNVEAEQEQDKGEEGLHNEVQKDDDEVLGESKQSMNVKAEQKQDKGEEELNNEVKNDEEDVLDASMNVEAEQKNDQGEEGLGNEVKNNEEEVHSASINVEAEQQQDQVEQGFDSKDRYDEEKALSASNHSLDTDSDEQKQDQMVEGLDKAARNDEENTLRTSNNSLDTDPAEYNQDQEENRLSGEARDDKEKANNNSFYVEQQQSQNQFDSVKNSSRLAPSLVNATEKMRGSSINTENKTEASELFLSTREKLRHRSNISESILDEKGTKKNDTMTAGPVKDSKANLPNATANKGEISQVENRVENDVQSPMVSYPEHDETNLDQRNTSTTSDLPGRNLRRRNQNS
mmetsp:Transcript_5595/g.7345  ORF Transcript_5595/g.7345 Transcript_5595/m.7345 type:complete len:622 (-) Transcript_5595:843-2708(-)|eukprot:CAMPEP_0184009138 /NCGR_PEP_ID=MMETSP0954-20121128/2415_1 /TAXON_ID=627963 /ORGANISM="Aplanochytrium sp, Strain PBS07" /LENGTH=621 /DNA_ID=CAMNT_0026288431 /DNA_START=82 /DNA_END=1947 /DNA_ORIENTATION=+